MLGESAYDADEVLEGIVTWAGVESPSHDARRVNMMMDLAAGALDELGARIDRLPGQDGFGDVVIGRLMGRDNKTAPGILVLSHLDTVHETGTLESGALVQKLSLK